MRVVTIFVSLILATIFIGCADDECADSSGGGVSFPVFYNFLEGDQDYFSSPDHSIDQLSFRSESQAIEFEGFAIREINNTVFVGIDFAFLTNHPAYIRYFLDFGNGDVDTLEFQNVEILRGLTGNLNCVEGRVSFIFNGDTIGFWDFDEDTNLSRTLANLNSLNLEEEVEPISFSIQK
ncbi:MAG: hypothetical protein RIF33_01975 [Cyclobacteriaceae bacterium]